MNKVMRTLTMAGLGLLAGATMGAPALAAESGATSARKSSKSQVQQDFGRERVVGFYRSYKACNKVGRIGDWTGKWDRFDCDPVRFGFKRGTWVLKVQRDRFGHIRKHDRHFGKHDGHFGKHKGHFGKRDGHFGKVGGKDRHGYPKR